MIKKLVKTFAAWVGIMLILAGICISAWLAMGFVWLLCSIATAPDVPQGTRTVTIDMQGTALCETDSDCAALNCPDADGGPQTSPTWKFAIIDGVCVRVAK